MTCCVAINAKEGDCWIQLFNYVFSLMLHKCHISYQIESTELRWSAKQIIESTEHYTVEIIFIELTRVSKDFEEEVSVNRDTKVNKGKLVSIEFARSEKED